MPDENSGIIGTVLLPTAPESIRLDLSHRHKWILCVMARRDCCMKYPSETGGGECRPMTGRTAKAPFCRANCVQSQAPPRKERK